MLALVFQDLHLTTVHTNAWRLVEVTSICATIWALVMPAWAAWAAPRRLGVALLAGWIWVGAAFWVYFYLFHAWAARFGLRAGNNLPIIAYGFTLLALSAVTVPFARQRPSATKRLT